MRALLRLLLAVVGWATSESAFAERRVALVIGNSAYVHAPALANPKNDAEGMAAALKRLKFEVLAGVDLDKPAMELLLQSYARALESADVALVFYAGHGLQVHGRNYLVPIDGKLDRESDLPFQAVPLDLIQGLMEQSQRTSIMILDACRDNPLARNLARTMGTRSTGIGRGLGETKAGIGTLIVYATQPGNVALDGDEKHSPFTLSLLKHMEAPGLEIRQVLTRVRNDVITATREKQVPWDSSSLRGDFFFATGATARDTPPGVTPGPAESKPPAPDQETVFWQSVKDSRNAADYKAYLAKYPQGVFAELAKLRIAEIEKAATVTPPPATVTPSPEKSSPQPTAPGKLQRTSTFNVGLGVAGTLLAEKELASARACQTLCLADTQCKAWQWAHDIPANAHTRRVCKLFGTLLDGRPSQESTSGLIRTVPVSAPAPQAPEKSPPAPKQGQRTSTWEPNRHVTSDRQNYKAVVPATAQACRAQCIAEAQCVMWYHFTTADGAQACHLHDSIQATAAGAAVHRGATVGRIRVHGTAP